MVDGYGIDRGKITQVLPVCVWGVGWWWVGARERVAGRFRARVRLTCRALTLTASRYICSLQTVLLPYYTVVLPCQHNSLTVLQVAHS